MLSLTYPKRSQIQYPLNTGNTVHCRVSSVYPPDHVATGSFHSLLMPRITRIIGHITSQHSKLKLWFLLNAHRPNKSRTVCIHLLVFLCALTSSEALTSKYFITHSYCSLMPCFYSVYIMGISLLVFLFEIIHSGEGGSPWLTW